MSNCHPQPFHPWHSLSHGNAVPDVVNGVIEIQQGSKAKYELDKMTGFLILDRILASHLSYPCYYGFVPQTLCEDKDPLDILILCNERLETFAIVESRIVGSICMHDDGEQDDKLIAVALHDPNMQHIRELNDVSEQSLTSIKHFFEEYKKPEGGLISVQGFKNRAQTYDIITRSITMYKNHFGIV